MIPDSKLCAVLTEQYNIFYKNIALYDKWNQDWVKLYISQQNLKSKTPLVLTIIIIVCALSSIFPIILFILASWTVTKDDSYNLSDYRKQYINDYMFIPSIVILFLIMLTTIIAICVYNIRKKSLRSKIKNYSEEMDIIKSQLLNYYNSVRYPLVPFECSSPYVLRKIYIIAKTGRAKTVNDAVFQYRNEEKQKLEAVRKQKHVRQQQVFNIAIASSAIYLMSRPDQIDIYL